MRLLPVCPSDPFGLPFLCPSGYFRSFHSIPSIHLIFVHSTFHSVCPFVLDLHCFSLESTCLSHWLRLPVPGSSEEIRFCFLHNAVHTAWQDCAVADANASRHKILHYKRQHACLAFVKTAIAILRVKNKVGVSANYQNIFTFFPPFYQLKKIILNWICIPYLIIYIVYIYRDFTTSQPISLRKYRLPK